MRAIKKLKIVNHEVWCPADNRAGVVLALILNEIADANLNRKVSQHASKCAETIHAVSTIKNKRVRQRMALMYLEHEKDFIPKREYPSNVADHLYGMLKTLYKENILRKQ